MVYERDFDIDDFIPKKSYSTKNELVFITNEINQYNKNKFIDKNILVIDYPKGKNIAIGYLNGKLYYTFNFEKVNENERVTKWLEQKIYPKVNKLVDQFNGMRFYLYGFLNKDGLIFYDFYINDNYVDFYYIKDWLSAVNLNTSEIIYEGFFNDDSFKNKPFIISESPIISTRLIAKKG